MNDQSDPPKKCSICGNAAVVAYRPFCSRRCADVDLGRWFSGGYAIPGDSEDRDAESDDKKSAPDKDV